MKNLILNNKGGGNYEFNNKARPFQRRYEEMRMKNDY